LIDAVDAVMLPDPAQGEAPDWKSIAGALDHFHTEWRKLGPIEHTVPHKERDKLVERMLAAVSRLDAPLREARRGAQQTREHLIARAKALAAEAAAGAHGRDTVNKVRELQAEWQQHARSLPLARGAENALWAEFKGTIDSIFSARDAVFNARDAELKAHGAERSALIARLEALTADTPPAEIKRTLADVDAQLRRIGPAPRNEIAALDERYDKAHDAAQRFLAGSAKRGWQATCDAWSAKVAQGESAKPAPAGGGPAANVSSDQLLLQLEAAFSLDSPPEFQAARREMKLLAMKAALESRSAKTPPLAPNQLLSEALARTSFDDSQRARLLGVIAALRERAPVSI
jgi:hypothetical protein